MEFEINGYIKDKKLKNKVNKESQKRFQKYRPLFFFLALILTGIGSALNDSFGIMGSIMTFVLTYIIILAIFEFKVYRELKNKKKK